jgi:NitT/TauT family transport system substrate-binding protein
MTQARSATRRPLAGLAATIVALSWPVAASAADDVHFILDWIPTGEHAAYYAGKAKGFFEEEDINIRISRGYGSGDTVAKLSGAAGDFGIADIAAVMTARQRQDAPVKTISIIYTHSPHSLFVLESSGIDGFKGLEGKKIGITPGNSHKLYFPKVAEQAGTDPNAIEWITVDASSMAAMLIAGSLDAAPFYSMHHYYQNKQAEQMGEKIKVLPFVEAGFTIYSGSLITTEEQIQNNPDLVRRFIRAVQKSWKFARDNQLEACELHVAANPEVDLDDCQGSLSATLGFVFNKHSDETGLGHYDPERLQFTYSAVAEAQELDPDWNPENAIDTSFLPE